MSWKPFALAVVVALAGAALIYRHIRQFELTASGGPPVQILQAKQDIALGTLLTRAMVRSVPIPRDYLEDRHIRASDIETVLGVRVNMELHATDFILSTDLASAARQRRTLASVVAPNMRAITVKASGPSTFGGLLRPGDRVDVLLTNDASASGPTTITLLQGLLVLAVGSDTGSEAGESRRGSSGGGRDNLVTLSATVEQSSVLVEASRLGALSLTLRHPEDIAIQENPPETTRDDIITAEKRARITHREPTDEPTPVSTTTIPEPIR